VCSRGKDVEAAAKNVYKNIDKISFEGMHYRKDIGVDYEQGK